MMDFRGEKHAVRLAIEMAEVYGYGNLISRLIAAWACKLLLENRELSVVSAIKGAWGQENELAQFGDLDRHEAIGAMRAYVYANSTGIL